MSAPVPVSVAKNGPDEHPTLGFVFALDIEAGSLVDRMRETKTTKGNGLTYHHGRLDGVSCVLVESGIGKTNAVNATETLLSVFRPHRVVSAGFAGALDPSLGKNTIHEPTRLVYGNESLNLEQKNGDPGLTLLTEDRLVDTIAEKRRLWEATGAHLVDMESFGVAEVCGKHQVAFQSVRIVFDVAEEELPKEVRNISAPQKKTAWKIGAFVSTLFKRPSCVLDLYQLRERALISADRLALYLEKNIVR